MWQSHKIKWDISTGKLKDMCGSQHMKKEGAFHPEEVKHSSDSQRHLRKSQISKSRTVSLIKQNQVKVKRGSKSSKLKGNARSFKVSLSENICIVQIKDTSIWHTRYLRALVQESPNSSLRQQQGAISREYRSKKPSYGTCKNIDKITVQN